MCNGGFKVREVYEKKLDTKPRSRILCHLRVIRPLPRRRKQSTNNTGHRLGNLTLLHLGVFNEEQPHVGRVPKP